MLYKTKHEVSNKRSAPAIVDFLAEAIGSQHSCWSSDAQQCTAVLQPAEIHHQHNMYWTQTEVPAIMWHQHNHNAGVLKTLGSPFAATSSCLHDHKGHNLPSPPSAPQYLPSQLFTAVLSSKTTPNESFTCRDLFNFCLFYVTNLICFYDAITNWNKILSFSAQILGIVSKVVFTSNLVIRSHELRANMLISNNKKLKSCFQATWAQSGCPS